MKAFTALLVLGVPVAAGVAYLKYTNNPLLDNIMAKVLPGGSFKVEDFYEASERDGAITAIKRLALSDDEFSEQKKLYKEYAAALESDVKKLNRLSAAQAETGDEGKKLKAQAFELAKLMYKLEKDFSKDALTAEG